ncbi:MAG TPA: hypothetical protein VGK37_11120 [Casimicrobiaceae bacterium]|jgi:hypothetical protein
MKIRTLVTQRRYYGMEAVALRAAMARVLSRVAGEPAGTARVSRRHLCSDFALDPSAPDETLDLLVADGLLRPPDENQADFTLTERFFEYATARVVEPLPRERARQLLGKACALAAHINAEWKTNPLEIAALAPFGSYISQEKLLAELPLGMVVRPRCVSRRARWTRLATRKDGARQIRAAIRELSTFFHIRMVSDPRLLPQPFAVVFHDSGDDDADFSSQPDQPATESRA